MSGSSLRACLTTERRELVDWDGRRPKIFPKVAENTPGEAGCGAVGDLILLRVGSVGWPEIGGGALDLYEGWLSSLGLSSIRDELNIKSLLVSVGCIIVFWLVPKLKALRPGSSGDDCKEGSVLDLKSGGGILGA